MCQLGYLVPTTWRVNHASLFSGIGGFDLAAQWMGWNNVFHCEWNPFCQKVLKHYWPDAVSYGDITKTDFTIWRGKCDILTGGFPCQPFSTAGCGEGENDIRFLWKEMLRAVREIKPTWIVAENVRGITSRKFSKTFEQILSSLEAEGYQVQSFIIPASAVGARHERYRLWIVAYAECFRLQGKGKFRNEVGNKKKGNRQASWPELLFQGKSVPHLYGHSNGIPKRLDGIAVSDWRERSNHGYGNAVVPQVAYEIFKAIESTNSNSLTLTK